MGFATALVEQLWDSRTAFVVLAYVVVAWLIRREKAVERYHLRAAKTLVAGHLISVVVAAGQNANNYDPAIAETVGLAFEPGALHLMDDA